MEGKILGGRYQIIHQVGSGGMANIYKAKDLVLERFVAVKIMNQNLIHDETAVLRFIGEAKAAGKMSHPNIVNVYDTAREGLTYYIVMEFIEGESLDQIIAHERFLPPAKAISIAIQICDGLAHAHEHQIIHRDIKPHNILATTNGLYKVADFGISRSLDSTTSITTTGNVMGSVHYFSPEQARGLELRFSSDLYSLGAVIYEMITGEYLYNAPESVTIALKHIQDPVPDPRQINPNIPSELVEILYKALQKDPNQRYQTAHEMKQALEHALTAIEAPLHTVTAEKLEQPLEAEMEKALLSRQMRHRRERGKFQSKWGILLLSIAGVFILLLLGMNMVFGHYGNLIENSGSNSPVTNTPTTIKPTEDQKKSKGNHAWWKEYPKFRDNDYFRKSFVVHGSKGEYDVSVDVGDVPFTIFYYSIYVVDDQSSRLEIKRQPVPFKKVKDKTFTTVVFHVSVPKNILPERGLVKVEIYNLKNGKKDSDHAIDTLLQQF